MFIELLLLFHAFTTWMIGGIILFVQVVYSPLYNRYKDLIAEYQKKNLIHMGNLMAPIFFLEVVSACILVFVLRTNTVYRTLAFINLGLIVTIWVVNGIMRLRSGEVKEFILIHKIHKILLSSNWFRTICWTIRGFIVLLMLLFSDICL